ncbi:response regulator receiver protein [Anaeromyxobacter sp. Fw109-5]|nr:response regulator receiver protein [Anaeromyxobacter sp. Fw109-5]
MALKLLCVREEKCKAAWLKEVPPRHFSCALHFSFLFLAARMASFLIVDADRNFREAIAIALRLDGHTAVVVASADEALARIGHGPLDCCVVDAHLLGADEVLEAAGAAGARTVVTGPHEDLLAHAARRHPLAQPLAKPFAADALAHLPAS